MTTAPAVHTEGHGRWRVRQLDVFRAESSSSSWLLLAVYAVFVPLVVLPVGGSLFLGLTDLLFPLGLAVALRYPAEAVRGPSFLYLGAASVLTFSSALAGPSELVRSLRIVAIFVPFFIVLAVPLRRAPMERLTQLVYLGGGLGAVAGIGLHLAGIEISPTVQQLFVGDGKGLIVRAGGLAGNTGPFGHLLQTWVLFGLLVAPRVYTRRWLIVLATMTVGAVGITISASRAAILSVVAGLLIFGALRLVIGQRHLFRLKQNTVFGIVVGALAIVVLVSLTPVTANFESREVSSAIDRINPFSSEASSDFADSDARLESWPVVIDALGRSPFIGQGQKAFEADSERFVDNSFLSMAVASGTIGLAFFIAFWLKLIGRGVRWGSHSVFATSLAAIATAQVLHSLTLDIHTLWYSMPFAFLVLGVQYRLCDLDLVADPTLTGQVVVTGYEASE